MIEVLRKILEKYPIARETTAFGGMHEIRSLFESLKESISSLEFIKNNQNLLVKYSYGKGNWAQTPWIAILDDRETTTTQKGTYVVILFRGDGDGCHLKLGQGVTEITEKFGSGANAVEELQRRAKQVREMFPEMLNTAFDREPQEIRGQANLTALYEASTIYSKYYKINALPLNEELSSDLEVLVKCYEDYEDRKGSKRHLVEHVPIESYDTESALRDLFISRDNFEEMLESLQNKKNLILQGPPGTGKSFVAKRLAYALLGYKDDSRIESIQFHHSFSYEDFIQGFRPKKDGSGFTLKDGVFYRFCQKALLDPERPYVFIIDEINRGNLSKIFGEVMLLIETDKRGPEWAVSLTYSDESASKFHIPANVRILGMMNTADRSLAIVDYALRRRFAFKDVLPGFDSDKFRPLLESKGVESQVISAIQNKMATLNKEIESSVDLGRGFTIGHSFFVPFQNVTDSNVWYERVIKNEIDPLLREYWFDKKQSEVDQHIQALSL